MVGTAQDIAKRVKSGRQQAQLAAHINSVLASTSEGIYGLQDGRCTFINTAGAAHLGYAPDELVAQPMHAQVHYQHADDTPFPIETCPIHQAMRSGVACRLDTDVLWRRRRHTAGSGVHLQVDACRGCARCSVQHRIEASRARHDGATRKSLAAYARAGALYATYCAHQRVGLLDIANEEFPSFVDGLLGLNLRDASGDFVHLDGHVRSRRSADLYIGLLYSLAGDVAHLYDVTFDWRRYRRLVGSEHGLTAVPRAHLVTGLGQRVHRVRHTTRKVVGLPDQEFEKMLRRAVELWGKYLAPGDRRFGLEPERQRGALLHRNVAILLCMRYAGTRRSEIASIRLDDVDRIGHHLDLETKGHPRGNIEYLPVVMYPEVAEQLWTYFTDYRPLVSTTSDEGYMFLSHGVRDYGRPITDSVIRDIFERLRPALSPRWSKLAAPHTLRHACAYQLQGRVSADVIMAQMRHRSTRSLDPYRASALAFADQLLPAFSGSAQELMVRVGLGG